MNLIYEFEVDGEPVACQRPKVSNIYGHAHGYTPQKTLDYEHYVGFCFKQKYQDAKPLLDPLRVDIEFYFPLIKSDYTKKGNLSKSGLEKLSEQIHPTTQKDIDNCIKSVLDGLNQIAYVDDKQVYDVHAIKKYSQTPKTIIKIYKEE